MTLAPSRNKMFVAVKSLGHVHIDRMSMKDGHDHHHIIKSGLSVNGFIHLAVDEKNEILYWSDSEKKRIYCSNFEGGNVKNFVKSIRKPGPIALISEILYWTSLNSMALQWLNNNGTGRLKMAWISKPPGNEKIPNVINIAIRASLEPSNHICMVNNGECSDICSSDESDRHTCLCESGHFFNDSNRTICINQTDCDFMCSTSGECLKLSQRCDGKIDCLDASDEKDCSRILAMKQCSAGHFLCSIDMQQCIPMNQRCDQNFNCKDRSDELNCETIKNIESCKINELKCPNGQCVDVTFRCDGKNDCGDNFDEREDVCLSACPANFFKCASGQCIPKESECNSYIDCEDFSDEHAECCG